MLLNLPVFFSALLPSVILLILACAILLASAFFKHKADAWMYGSVYLGLLVCLGWLVGQYSTLATPLVLAHGRLLLDSLSLFGSIFVVGLSAMALSCARVSLQQLKLAHGEYLALVLFSVIGMLLMMMTHHLLLLFITLELMTFPLYILCAYQRASRHGAEAAMKYFVTGALASGFLLYGISLIYGAVHTLNFMEIGLALRHVPAAAHPSMALAGMIFMVVALAFKLGAAPFHGWLVDVYEGAPSALVVFLATAPKIALFVLLWRVLDTAFPSLSLAWSSVLTWIAFLSLVLGNSLAFSQRNLRRLLAYASVAQMGIVFLGVASAASTGAISSALFYMLSYAVVAAGTFALLNALTVDGRTVSTLEDLAGLNRQHPWCAFLLLLFLFSMAGLPLSIGFIAKLSVLLVMISAGHIVPAVFVVLMSIFGLFYYLQPVKIMYFNDEPHHGVPPVFTISAHSLRVISIIGISVLVLGFFPTLLLSYC